MSICPVEHKEVEAMRTVEYDNDDHGQWFAVGRVQFWFPWNSTPEREKAAHAEATLYAAAPDLLIAAQEALSDFEWIERTIPKSNFHASIIRLRLAIQAAGAERSVSPQPSR
jgi:hypothetical protein